MVQSIEVQPETQPALLDAVLAEGLAIWKAWRAENHPPVIDVKWHRTKWADMTEYEDARAEAWDRPRAVIPEDKPTLLALAAEDRVWESYSEGAFDRATIAVTIRECIWLIMIRMLDEYDANTFGGS